MGLDSRLHRPWRFQAYTFKRARLRNMYTEGSSIGHHTFLLFTTGGHLTTLHCRTGYGERKCHLTAIEKTDPHYRCKGRKCLNYWAIPFRTETQYFNGIAVFEIALITELYPFQDRKTWNSCFWDILMYFGALIISVSPNEEYMWSTYGIQ